MQLIYNTEIINIHLIVTFCQCSTYNRHNQLNRNMTIKKTNWSSPKTNIIAAVNDLRKCLASGHKARLIRALNEECEFPILLSKDENSRDFRDYEFSIGTLRTKEEIKNDQSMSEFEKKLSLEYRSCFGDVDAIEKYYTTGVLSDGNFKGIGRSHLVKVTDMIEFLNASGKPKDKLHAENWMHYIDETDDRHFYDTFRLKNKQQRTAKKFNHKLWVVQMIDSETEQPALTLGVRILMTIITTLVSPLKYVPRKSVLRMPEYTLYDFRIGDVVNGFKVEFQLPKKFSFK